MAHSEFWEQSLSLINTWCYDAKKVINIEKSSLSNDEQKEKQMRWEELLPKKHRNGCNCRFRAKN
jgi:hypothetical protein